MERQSNRMQFRLGWQFQMRTLVVDQARLRILRVILLSVRGSSLVRVRRIIIIHFCIEAVTVRRSLAIPPLLCYCSLFLSTCRPLWQMPLSSYPKPYSTFFFFFIFFIAEIYKTGSYKRRSQIRRITELVESKNVITLACFSAVSFIGFGFLQS